MSTNMPVADFVSKVRSQLPPILNSVGANGIFNILEVVVIHTQNGSLSVDFAGNRGLSGRPRSSSIENMVSRQLGRSTSFQNLTPSETFKLRESATIKFKDIADIEVPNFVCFVGSAQIVQDNLLIPVLNIDQDSVKKRTTVKDESRPFRILGGRRYEKTSFLHEIGYAIANKVSETLPYLKDGPTHLSGIPSALPRRAARELMKQPGHQVAESDISHRLVNSLYTHISEVSRLTYEKSRSRGTVVFQSQKEADISRAIRFDPVVQMRSHRRFRKLLETSKRNLVLLADESAIYANQTLEVINSARKSDSENLPKEHYAIKFKGGHEWDLCFGSQALMSVTQDRPRLPERRLEQDKFERKVRAIFSSPDEDALWEIVDQAIQQPHGTMIVITSDAKEESNRLSNESTKIYPKKPSRKQVMGLTSIDGSLMVNPRGTCTAIGVILDGKSKPHSGDPSRGARHNAARRYYETVTDSTGKQNSDAECMIITVSEDGGVSILPE